jgi:hypothetical protein
MAIEEGWELYLGKSPFPKSKGKFIGHVVKKATLFVGDLAQLAAGRKSADISAEAIEHGANLLLAEAAAQLKLGRSVKLGHIVCTPEMEGVFQSLSSHYDRNVQRAAISCHADPELSAEVSSVSVKILGEEPSGFFIAEVVDIKTGKRNYIITPGRNLLIIGGKIKVVGDHITVGIYFVNVLTGERVKVDDDDIVENTRTHLLIVNPALSAGGWQVEVTTQDSSGTLLKEPRTFRFEPVLTVL